MANMSYCRFENTLSNLNDCFYAVRDMDSESYRKLSGSEKFSLEEMVLLCKEFIKETEWVSELGDDQE